MKPEFATRKKKKCAAILHPSLVIFTNPVGLVVAMSVCLFTCLSPFHVLDFEAYFAPISRSRMSKICRASESLGKSAGRKGSQNWTFLLGSCLKSPRKKKVFFSWFSLQNMVETPLPHGIENSGRRAYRLPPLRILNL